MSKWYKSALVKGILIFLSVLSAITALLSLVIISTYSVSVKEIWNKKPTEYTDSKEFENQMCRATMDVLGQISYEDIFETDGKYNPDKLIDIMQYGYNGRHYDEETERLRYKLSDLQKWSEEYQNNYATQENPIVVCQKADKTYHYYYWDEFLSLLKKKTLTVDIDGYTSDEIVNALASGNVSLSQFAGHDILDEKGETVYRDFWGFSGAIEEEARPDGGNNILDVVNQTPQLNGKLSEVYAQLGSILSNLYYDFQSYQNSAEWTEGNTNFAYIFVDKETKKVYTNRKEYQDYNSVKENISDIQKNAKYMIVQPKLSDFKTNMDITANDWKEFVKSQRRNSNGDFIFAAAVDTRFSIQDSFYLDKKLYDEYAPYINRAVILLGAAVLLIIVSLIWLAADAFIVYYLVLNAIAKNKIIKGIKAVAGGDLEYQISLEHLRGEQREVAEMLNDIGTGLQKAVEKSVKSERLKTDLITNVSHDIKTPLTSIINYVDILKRSNIEDPKIQGYLEILEAKAQRLKTLTEDVVEASKVSSGNINLQLMDVNLVEMMNQTTGEFAEKFEHKNLELIQTLPNEPAIIHVDGRRMWRVLENLYNNAAKYAMPGTRIYADLRTDKDEVIFSLKNVSEYPLNFSADELTERFIRGDISRSTEGNGLGLSIAKSLVQMQGGKLELYLDGDLFKATVRFRKADKKEQDSCFFRENSEEE